MTLAHATESAEHTEERTPDSANLRVSLNTAYESGIPPARERLSRSADSDAAIDQLELVLVESTRAEANLGLLLRGLKHLAAGASAAQEANSVLVQELELLRSRMGKVYESESLLQKRVQTLENSLDTAARERESWLVQEDAFLGGLLDEHEQKLFELERGHERKLAEIDLAFDELRAQYDSARTEVTRLTYERDAAVALLNEPMPATQPILGSRSLTPPLSVATGARSATPPPLKSKPNMSSRPLVGYSMVADDLEDEDEDELDKKITSRPPQM